MVSQQSAVHCTASRSSSARRVDRLSHNCRRAERSGAEQLHHLPLPLPLLHKCHAHVQCPLPALHRPSHFWLWRSISIRIAPPTVPYVCTVVCFRFRCRRSRVAAISLDAISGRRRLRVRSAGGDGAIVKHYVIRLTRHASDSTLRLRSDRSGRRSDRSVSLQFLLLLVSRCQSLASLFC